MKKLIVFTLMCAAAIAVQAADLNWGGVALAGWSNPEGDPDFLSSGTVAYLIYSEAAIGNITKLELGESGAATAFNGASSVGASVQKYDFTEGDLGGMFATKYANEDATKLNGYYAVVLVDGADATKGSFYNYGEVSGYVDSKSAIVDLAERAMGMEPTSTQFIGANGFTVAVGSSVPEPTSGVLMLLGLGLLGLRRRHA